MGVADSEDTGDYPEWVVDSSLFQDYVLRPPHSGKCVTRSHEDSA